MLHSLSAPLAFAATAKELAAESAARESHMQGHVIEWMQFCDYHFGFLDLRTKRELNIKCVKLTSFSSKGVISLCQILSTSPVAFRSFSISPIFFN
jgi:hypothetical protein